MFSRGGNFWHSTVQDIGVAPETKLCGDFKLFGDRKGCNFVPMVCSQVNLIHSITVVSK